MSKSLYTKYRPQLFNDVVGQKTAKKILINSIVGDEIKHAYLFYGIRGAGKTTLARLFAKAINCTNLNNYEPCNKCESCINIISSSSFDVVEIDAASNNGVEEIRNLIEKTNYMSTFSKNKIYIIDEIHMLSKSAFNALLKTLEEPPKNTIFLLATTEINRIPETILSRSLIINLEILSNDSIIKGLKTILNKEGVHYTDEGLEYITTTSGGSLRDAISALETVLLHSGKVNKETVISSLGLLDTKIIKDLLSTNLIELSKYIENEEKDPKKIINLLLNILTSEIKKGDLTNKILMKDVLDILISLKDPNLIRIALVSSLLKNVSNVSRETLSEPKTDLVVKELNKTTNLDTAETNLLNEKTQEIKFADDLLKREQLKEDVQEGKKTIVEKKVIAEKKEENIDEVIIKKTNKELEQTAEKNTLIKSEIEKEFSLISFPKGTTEKDLSVLMDDTISDIETQEIDVKTPLDKVGNINYNVDITSYINAKHYVQVLQELKQDVLNRFKDRWSFIPQYQNSLQHKEIVSLLANTEVLATNGVVVIIGFESREVYIEFKQHSLTKELLVFVSEIFGKEVILLPIMPEQWSKILILHQKTILAGQVISEPLNIPNIKVESKQISHLKDVFGDSLEFE